MKINNFLDKLIKYMRNSLLTVVLLSVVIFDGLNWDILVAIVGVAVYVIGEEDNTKNIGLALLAAGLLIHLAAG